MTPLRLVGFTDLSDAELDTWRALRAANPLLDSPYFDPAFAAAVQASGVEVTVALDGRGSELTRLVACHREGATLRPVGWPGADFQGPVLAAGTPFDPHELLVDGVRTFEFDHWLLPSPAAAPWVETRAASPFVEVAGGLDGYLSRASKSGRDNIGQARRRTARAEREHGSVTFRAQSSDLEALAWLVDRKRAQYAATGARDYFAPEHRRTLLSLLLDTNAGALALGRRPGSPGRVADHRGQEPGDRPAAARAPRRRSCSSRRRLRKPRSQAMDDDIDESGIEDDRLRLIFTCCHPALPLEGRVALTLRTLAGLTTAEIARAFLVPEPTMAKRLVRAKGKIAGARIPYRVPPAASAARAHRRGARGALSALQRGVRRHRRPGAHPRPAVRRGDSARPRAQWPHARRARGGRPAGADAVSRTPAGERGSTRRATWSPSRTRTAPCGTAPRSTRPARVCRRRCATAGPGPYQLQAAIAACHADAADVADTDWGQIASLYELLAEVMPSPVVALNRAVAIAMTHGPDAGLEVIDELEASGELAGYHLLHATRADLLRRLGRHDDAAVAYREALELAGSDAERRFLEKRLRAARRNQPSSVGSRDAYG